MSPAPIVICGHRAEMADKVNMGMQPEFETIHVILNPEAGATQLPSLLSGSQPTASEPDSQATRNYSQPPVAVLVSATYKDDDVEQMRKACAGAPRGVPWLRPDIAAMKESFGGEMPKLGSDEHASMMCGRMKGAIERLVREGKLGQDGVVWF